MKRVLSCLLGLALLASGCDDRKQPSRVDVDVHDVRESSGTPRWHVTVDVYIEARTKSEAAAKVAGMLESIGKSMEDVPAEKP